MTIRASLSLVVGGLDDANLIRAIVGKDIAPRLRFFAAQGRASLVTIGRNVLIHEGGPVLLVMDSDTRNRHLVEEMRSMAGLAMSGATAGGFGGGFSGVGSGTLASPPLFEVYVFVPDIDVMFFESPDVLRRLLGTVVTEERLREGMLTPKETLSLLLRESGKYASHSALVIAASEPEVAEALASGQQASALVGTIKPMTNELLAR